MVYSPQDSTTAIFEKCVTDPRTNRRTNGRTKPLIVLYRCVDASNKRLRILANDLLGTHLPFHFRKWFVEKSFIVLSPMGFSSGKLCTCTAYKKTFITFSRVRTPFACGLKPILRGSVCQFVRPTDHPSISTGSWPYWFPPDAWL